MSTDFKVAAAVDRVLGGDIPLRVEAYDGSTAGPLDSDAVVEVRDPAALSYVITAPGSLGLARAYVTGALDVRGDIHGALTKLMGVRIDDMRRADVLALVRGVGAKALRRPPLPPQERQLHGWRHSKRRDAQAISHHYDVSNRFYELVLGPSMAYTCAVYPELDATLEQAQHEKFDLVARKLDLKPGMRLLDVGCGWGGMVMHAAQHYGVTALGATLSREQAQWAQKAIADAGLTDRAEVRFSDYRDIGDSRFDAISSIGLTEHIGTGQLDSYIASLHAKLLPGGRLLNHCITRPTTKEDAKAGAFISRYVFPDGELQGVGTIVSALQDGGFEVRHSENLREHYAMTLRDWGRNLEDNWDEAVAEVGLTTARVWRLYMAGSRVGFEERQIELHQVLAAKPDGNDAKMPLRPTWAG